MCAKKIFYKVYAINIDGSLEDLNKVISISESEIRNQYGFTRGLTKEIFKVFGFGNTYASSFQENFSLGIPPSIDDITISYCDWRGSLALEGSGYVPHWKLVRL